MNNKFSPWHLSQKKKLKPFKVFYYPIKLIIGQVMNVGNLKKSFLSGLIQNIQLL